MYKMGSGYFNIFNFNAFRCRNIGKIRNYYDFFEQYSPVFVFIQEINISSALTIFGDKFQVFVNVESDAQDGIGIVTLVRKGLYVSVNFAFYYMISFSYAFSRRYGTKCSKKY